MTSSDPPSWSPFQAGGVSVCLQSWLKCSRPLRVSVVSDRRWKKDVGLPASSCFSLIGIPGTQSLPQRLLHVPRRHVGNEGMESGGVERRSLHLMLCGPKNSRPPPFFCLSVFTPSVFPRIGLLPVPTLSLLVSL